jgi:two-component system CheB/CheR fusion protein
MAAEQSKPEQSKPEPTVIGIGASAGGLAALKTFLQHVPPDSGLAFVVVVHLSPDHESHLAELLQPHVPFPVEQVSDSTPLQGNHVYVIPPNANLNTIDTHLRLSKLEKHRRERAPIDHFFRTLASTHDGQAIAVILTGTGSDGTLGVKDVKANGGLVIVQDPNEAEYDGMPQSAIATGLADFILPVAEIPGAILRFDRTAPRLPQPKDGEDVPQNERMLLQKVFAQLRARTDRDFSRYKRSTVLRRVARRMQLNYLEDLQAYLEKLRERPEEVRALADDLLITVTHFFRDPEVFEKLQTEIIPRLFEKRGPGDVIRVWSVGCATGEEAYSIGMLLVEAGAKHELAPHVQVFASDLHARSLEKAREGFYPGDIETDVSAERLKRFFNKENGGFRVRKELRDLVVFAPHNILADPPFSRLDLISCRNLLIYLERDVQRDVIELFHYALNPEGTLMLGSAESIDAQDLFRVEDKRLCFFRKRNVPSRDFRLPVFPLTRTRLPGEPGPRPEQSSEPVAYGRLHQQMVERYAPPSILVSPENKLVHLSENAGRYLNHPGGEPTANVLKVVRPELRIDLQASLQAARESKQAVDSKPVPVRFNGHPRPVVLHVRTAKETEREGYALVIFEEREPGREDEAPAAAVPPGHQAERIQELENELTVSRQRLQAIIEEYESSQEEMKASSEEMQSTNEELRSTLEELETSKEELQSINEELQTVNQQNRQKVDELAQLSSDLQNLLTSTEIATLFLDRNFRILRFTPKLGDLFNIRSTDRGRPISDLTHRLGYAMLRSDAEAVLNRLAPIEREVQDDAGRWYLTRVLPYRSTDDRIEGVVITFVDIDSRKRSAEALRASEERLRRMLSVAVVGVLIFDNEGRLVDCNEAYLKMSGFTKEEVASKTLTWRTLTPPEHIESSEQQFAKVAQTGTIGPYEKEYFRKDGSRVWMLFVGASLGDGTIIEYCIDISDRKRAEQQVLEAKSYAETIIESLHEPLLILDTNLELRSANPAFFRSFHVEPATVIGRKIYEFVHIPALRTLLEDVVPNHSVLKDFQIEQDIPGKGIRTFLVNARELDHDQLILVSLRDITERSRAEKDLREAERNVRTANEALLSANMDLKHFSYAVSHDMREPLRMVTSYTQLLAQHLKDNPDKRIQEYTEFAVTGARRMETLLNDLREYWSVAEQKVEHMPVETTPVLQQALAYLETAIAESGAVVSHDSLPAVPGEPYPLTLLFQNIIGNAVKYRRPEQPPRIHVSASRDGNQLWTFSVADNGIGIPEQHLDEIFRPFKRLHGWEYPGTGLGLAMARKIVERYGGRIWVESKYGEGSTFYFTLPMLDANP